MTNCTFARNRARTSGGAILCYTARVSIANCVFWDNQALNGPQIGLRGGSAADLAYSDLQAGQNALRSNNPTLAITECTRAIQLNPNDAQAYFCRALAYDNAGKNDLAIQDYTEAIRLTPKFSTAYVGRGVAFARKGDFDKAIADYARIIDMRPEPPLRNARRVSSG